MNTIRATVFLIVLSLSGGCASVAPAGPDLAPAGLKSCVKAPSNRINIVYQKHNRIQVSPPKLDVEKGEEILYFVRGEEPRAFEAKGTKPPPNTAASVTWLNATGTGGTVGDGNSFKVCVPEHQESGDYEYVIKIEGVGTLDPVVHVNR